jgi:methyltransferase-like protein 23
VNPTSGPAASEPPWPLACYEETFDGVRLRWQGFANLQETLNAFIAAAADREFADPASEQAALARIPYYGGLWPSARALAAMLAVRREQLPGTAVLELGCGLALPAMLAARWGARVLATDFHPAVAELLHGNIARNELADSLRYQQDWRTCPDLGARYPWIIGSDILYEAAQVPTMVTTLRRHLLPGGTVLITDPGRAYVQAFVTAMEHDGWQVVMDVLRVTDEQGTHDIFTLACQQRLPGRSGCH